MLIKRCASVASGSLPAWRATRAAHFLKSGASDIRHSSNPDPSRESEEAASGSKKARDPANLDRQSREPPGTAASDGRCYRSSCGSGAPPSEMGPAGLTAGGFLRGALTAGRTGATGVGAGAAAVCSTSSLAVNAES